MEKFKYKYDDLFNPVLKALQQLGGSGTNIEIEDEIGKILNLSDEEAEDIHRGNTTKVTYRSAWAKNYLKRYGIVENSARGVWALTARGRATKEVDKEAVKKMVKNIELINGNDLKKEEECIDSDKNNIDIGWEEELISILKMLEPSAFERLSKRLLRELGFQSVEVTGKTGDGGIDGVGAIKINGVLSFNVVFQCKRYSGSVSSGAIRDFRGAMIGRAEKGLFITTGVFTRDAKTEARRDGAPAIDLIDGNEFAKRLKELNLGVDVEQVEKVSIKKEWFLDI